MFAAAGIVVTETSTPTSAPVAVLGHREHAGDAGRQRDHGGEPVRMRDERREPPVARLVARLHHARRPQEQRQQERRRGGRPQAHREGAAARPIRCRRGSTSATHRAAIGPKSGATTTAPTFSTGESVRMPQAESTAPMTMNTRNEVVTVDVLAGPGLDLLPDQRVGRLARGLGLGPQDGVGERHVDRLGDDGAVAVHAEGPERPSITAVRRLPRHVDRDDVARRHDRSTRAGRSPSATAGSCRSWRQHVIGAIGRDDQAQVQQLGTSGR